MKSVLTMVGLHQKIGSYAILCITADFLFSKLLENFCFFPAQVCCVRDGSGIRIAKDPSKFIKVNICNSSVRVSCFIIRWMNSVWTECVPIINCAYFLKDLNYV